MKRASGILLSVTSLPGPYGIGSLGRPAREFIDFLHEAGQHYWQILPLVPPGEGASPYMSHSAYAGNPMLIDLEELAQKGLLTKQELASARYDDPDRVDYAWLNRTRLPLLRLAYRRHRTISKAKEEEISLPWLEDYARFAALHDRYGTSFRSWPKSPAPPDEEETGFHRFLQRTFYRQWFSLKQYANEKGISLIGDLPFYLSDDSTEVWLHPEIFQFGLDGKPSCVSGVPPDAFTADGQLWGQPLYDWHGHKKEVWAFWHRRMAWCARLYDAVRIDHFRAFHTYWSVPANAKSAKEGHWEPGPGMPFLHYLQRQVPGLQLIAEDLGDLGPEALEFIRTCGIPGMKVLVFAFDPAGDSAYLPHNCTRDSVIYTGTHDTPTFVEWLTAAAPEERAFATEYLRLRLEEGLGWGAVASAWATPCHLSIAPLQDVLGLGGDARMNTPGTTGAHNWSWRVRGEALNPVVSGKLNHLTKLYRR